MDVRECICIGTDIKYKNHHFKYGSVFCFWQGTKDPINTLRIIVYTIYWMLKCPGYIWCFTIINTFNLWDHIRNPLYIWWNWGSESLSNLVHVSQLVSRLGISTKTFLHFSKLLLLIMCLSLKQMIILPRVNIKMWRMPPTNDIFKYRIMNLSTMTILTFYHANEIIDWMSN